MSPRTASRRYNGVVACEPVGGAREADERVADFDVVHGVIRYAATTRNVGDGAPRRRQRVS
jgi:hypothetical protein